MVGAWNVSKDYNYNEVDANVVVYIIFMGTMKRSHKAHVHIEWILTKGMNALYIIGLTDRIQ